MRIIAIMGGGDWSDASVDFVEVEASLDIDDCHKQYTEWYQYYYLPELKKNNKPKYYSFPEWLVDEELALNTDAVEDYWYVP